MGQHEERQEGIGPAVEVPVQNRRKQHGMTKAGNREKLGDALKDAEDDGLKV